ncbi:hypothetical protein [Glycomyces algeriensis]|uniref:Uncharacterized protein n=1 Tax=Glycomyces algeriensis TaxID=256037 RepID=A0A9W6GC13_9ACTN|nr:hypothetical protein [Glycomyces algeriensis]MDA1365732.1 hypothetical protein [Glycomyces algeriensis]MDR7351421.1 hypothetical protein [Glycomyces algeriensis]GLI44141.1 hypothetical protein GALLR39Z86_39910 [Glycomyces algeriensis]
MEANLDTGLQVIGVAAAVAGTYFAYRQYRLSRHARPVRGTVGEDGDVEHFACLPYPQVGDVVFGYLMGAFGCGIALLAVFDRDLDGTPEFYFWILLGLGFVLAAVGLLEGDKAPFRIELTEREFTVRRRFPNTHFVAVPWANVDHIAVVTSPEGHRQVVVRLPKGGGFAPGMPGDFYSTQVGGYIMCEMKGAEPTEAAFLAALRRYTGTDVRV